VAFRAGAFFNAAGFDLFVAFAVVVAGFVTARRTGAAFFTVPRGERDTPPAPPEP